MQIGMYMIPMHLKVQSESNKATLFFQLMKLTKVKAFQSRTKVSVLNCLEIPTLFLCKLQHYVNESDHQITSQKDLLCMFHISSKRFEVCEGGSLEAACFHTSGFHLLPLQGHQKFGCPYQWLCVCVFLAGYECVLRKLMFCLSRRGQRSSISTVTRRSEIVDSEEMDSTMTETKLNRACLLQSSVFGFLLSERKSSSSELPATVLKLTQSLNRKSVSLLVGSFFSLLDPCLFCPGSWYQWVIRKTIFVQNNVVWDFIFSAQQSSTGDCDGSSLVWDCTCEPVTWCFMAVTMALLWNSTLICYRFEK